jgi:hypothetical protein
MGLVIEVEVQTHRFGTTEHPQTFLGQDTRMSEQSICSPPNLQLPAQPTESQFDTERRCGPYERIPPAPQPQESVPAALTRPGPAHCVHEPLVSQPQTHKWLEGTRVAAASYDGLELIR